MAFDVLQERLGGIFKRFRGQGVLTEKQMEEGLREVRLALLEADVALPVVKEFIDNVKGKALGEEVMKGLNPGQQVIKLVNDELVRLLGGDIRRDNLQPGQRNVIMMVGLQGSGKTTHAAKLAAYLTKREHRCMLVAADIYRPAAIEQLKIMGERIDVPVYAPGPNVRPEKIAEDALTQAFRDTRETVILDTAGRLHIDDDMMEELVRVKQTAKPSRIYLVLDAMVGQDAVNQGRFFHEKLGLSGVILTKLDGDARGGAALSVRSITGVPIMYAGDGEKIDDFDLFHPDRMASRILGMGDVLSVIERAQEVVDQDEAAQLQQRIMNQTFTLEDFLKQISYVKKMGGISRLMKMMPGMDQIKQLQDMDMSEDELVHVEAMINSMTMEERRNPRILGANRRKRIARGSGHRLQDLNRLINQFEQARKMMRMMTMQQTAVGKAAKDKISERKKQQKKRSKQSKRLTARKERERKKASKQIDAKQQSEQMLQKLQSIQKKNE